MAEFNKCLLYLLIILMVVTGSINTIATKIQQKIALNTRLLFEGHQWFITYGMFIGEMFLLGGYLTVVLKRKKEEKLTEEEKQEKFLALSDEDKIESKKGRASNFVFIISASCDLCATTISTFGITYLSSSMFQMFRGLELLFVMFFAKFFLGNPIYRHHVLGVGSVVFGLFLVGLNSLLNKDASATNPTLGMILVIISQVFSSSQYVIQEKILVKYFAHPFQLVGFEGFWGFSIYTVILIIFQNISCDSWDDFLKQNICYGDLNNNYKLENTLLALEQMGANVGLLLIVLLYIISIAVYNYVGINLTKLVSSTARAIVDTVRTVFVWFFFLWFPWVPESAVETFYWLQLVGFIFLILGTLIYNEIVPLPFLELDYNYRDRLKKREKAEELKKDAEKALQIENFDLAQKDSIEKNAILPDVTSEGTVNKE